MANTDLLQLQKNWARCLRKRAGRCQNVTGNWNARQRHLPLGRGKKRLIGIVIVAHGGLAREYLAAVEHVVGPQDAMRAIAIEDDHDRAGKQAEICMAADSVDRGAGVVVVTDMFGGSPSNLSLMACAGPDRRIVSLAFHFEMPDGKRFHKEIFQSRLSLAGPNPSSG